MFDVADISEEADQDMSRTDWRSLAEGWLITIGWGFLALVVILVMARIGETSRIGDTDQSYKDQYLTDEEIRGLEKERLFMTRLR